MILIPPPGEGGDWSEWKDTVHDAATSILSVEHASPENVYFEIWNEPNGALTKQNIPIGEGFWPYIGNYTFKKHFVDMWNHACKVIKNIDPNIKVVGPSFSVYDKDKIENYFLMSFRERMIIFLM